MPLIDTACHKYSPGWLMGIGRAPERKAEHDTRLGAAAGQFNDIGWVLGTVKSRDNWPAPPVAAQPAQGDTGAGTGTGGTP
jgi:hypothetical protein